MRFAPFVAILLAGCYDSPNGMPSIIVAARNGNGPQIRELVRRGADPNAPYGSLNWTPLMHAIYKNQIAAAEALLDSGADVNRTGDYETEPRTKQHDVTPLMMAAGFGYTPIVELLLRRGADPARIDSDGRRALDYALSGTLYRSTLFGCQSSTVRALLAGRAPRAITPETRKFARFKRCDIALLQ